MGTETEKIVPNDAEEPDTGSVGSTTQNVNTAVDQDTVKVVLGPDIVGVVLAKAVDPGKTNFSVTALDPAKLEITIGVVSTHIGIILTNAVDTDTVRVLSYNAVDLENVNVMSTSGISSGNVNTVIDPDTVGIGLDSNIVGPPATKVMEPKKRLV